MFKPFNSLFYIVATITNVAFDQHFFEIEPSNFSVVEEWDWR